MQALKYLTAIWAFAYSCICFALSNGTSFDSRFSDDLFVLIFFSGLVAGGVILNIKSDIFNYAKAIISLWFPVSAIFHWLTINEWTKWNFCFSMVFIAASVLFAFTQFADCIERKKFPIFLCIYLAMVAIFILSMLNMHYNDNTLSSICMTVYVSLTVSQVIRHCFPGNDSSNPNEDEYIKSNPTYKGTFFKVLCLILLATVFFSATSFFANVNLLTRLTHPSAFYYVADTFMPLPGLIWLALCCFDSLRVSCRVKNTLLFIQSALVATRIFFNLRPEYFDSLFTNTNTQIGILALLFFTTTYCYYAFEASRITPILTGTAYILLTCSGFVTESYSFDEMSVAMLISVFTFVCTIIKDYILDRKFKKELNFLLDRLKAAEKLASNGEPDRIDGD